MSYSPLTGHVLQHVSLVVDDVAELHLLEEDPVLRRGDDHVVRGEDDVILELVLDQLES